MESISLARGVPAPECLPSADLADCARAAIDADGDTVLSYGPGGGYPLLREWIAERHGVEPKRVVLTNGSLQGFQFVAELLATNGPVLVEAPTYDRPLKILASLGAAGCMLQALLRNPLASPFVVGTSSAASRQTPSASRS